MQQVGVIGVTGAVGKEIIEVLHNRKFPVSELKLFASARSAGKPMATPYGEKKIEEFTLEAARACDVVLLAVSGDFALEWVPKITADGGPLCIDNSSAYRYDDNVPLVVPEINADVVKEPKGVIANPNCTTAIASWRSRRSTKSSASSAASCPRTRRPRAPARRGWPSSRRAPRP
jgi:aspartate-semialdehyde dehydrogenase